MTAKTLTISMSEEDFKYLQEDGLLSPSKIFQVALFQLRESRASLKEENNRLIHANRVLQAKLLEATDLKGGCNDDVVQKKL